MSHEFDWNKYNEQYRIWKQQNPEPIEYKWWSI